MAPELLLYGGALVLAMILALGMAIRAFLRLNVAGAPAFLFGNLAAFSYTFGSLMEITSTTPDQVLAALTTEYLGITTIGPLLILTALLATGGRGSVSPRLVAGLFVVPALIVGLVATNSLHHLYYTTIELSQRGPFTVPVLGKGPLYMVNMVYMNACLLWGTLLFWRASRKGPREQKTAYRLFLAASVLPWSGMVWYQTGTSPWGLDVAPFGLVLSEMAFALALFRYGLFDKSPMILDQVFENMGEGVFVVDAQKRLAGFNPALARMAPGLSSSMVGLPMTEIQARVPTLKPLCTDQSGRCEELLVVEGQREQVFQVDTSALRDYRGRPIGEIYLLTDVTRREALAKRLALLARTDELTGLPNRRAFLERIAAEADRCRRYGGFFSLAIADIDHFKNVNDTHGHEVGDAALAHATTLWSSCLRSSDLLARWGGEEFTILLPETNQEDAAKLLERMRLRLAESPLAVATGSISLTASFGLMTTGRPPEGRTEDWVHQADQALYAAKNGGRNQVRVS